VHSFEVRFGNVIGVDRLTGLKHDGDNWVLEVCPGICNPWGGIHGGAAVGACVSLAAEETGAPVRWVTTRVVREPRMEELLTLHLTADAVGRRTSHVGVRATAEGEVAFDAMLVVGPGDQRPQAASGQWVAMPDVPAPENCELIPVAAQAKTYAQGRVERRVALGPRPHVTGERGPGRTATWVRFADPEVDSGSPAALAWMADDLAVGLGRAVGRLSRGTSFDSTVRYAFPAPTDWVLVDSHATGAGQGYAYGEAHLFGRAGELLATGSQTVLAGAGGERPANL
jgi:acyl-CoA thioesterase II